MSLQVTQGEVRGDLSLGETLCVFVLFLDHAKYQMFNKQNSCNNSAILLTNLLENILQEKFFRGNNICHPRSLHISANASLRATKMCHIMLDTSLQHYYITVS
jgi:hypothetical protein